MTTREARCSCGQLRVTCQGEPALVAVCHCQECQRRTGSAYGIAAFFAREAVTLAGSAADYDRPGGSGFRVLQHFCPGCGSTVFWEPARRPELIAVAVGAFADPGFPAPQKAVFEEHRHPWAAVALDSRA